MSKEKVEVEFNKKLIVPSNTEVVRSRDFGRVKGHLTRNQRVGFASLIKNAYLITLEENNKEMRDFEVPLNTILNDMGINHDNIFEDKSSTTVSLEKSLDELTEKKFEWRYKENGKVVRSGKAVMISDFDIDKSKRTVKFTLSKFVHDRLICYGNAYISEMPIIASFRSGYSVALHEQLEQRKSFQKWKVEVEEFKVLMGIAEDEYPRIGNLKLRIINPAINEIEKNTEYFNLKYKSIKNGRSISHFEFTWGIDKKEKEHKGQKNFADIDSQIEDLKTKVFKINDFNCKLIDIVTGTETSEFIAKIETVDGRKANIKLKVEIQESIELMKSFII